MPIRFTALPTADVAAWRRGAADAYGRPPEDYGLSDGACPCRHCLKMVPRGERVLVLAVRPFPTPQPYAETCPVFLCAQDCAPGGGPDLPAFLAAPDYLLKGYGADHRIVYGTGRIVATATIPAEAEAMLTDPRVAYVDVRSARNNCFHCRIERD